MCSQSRIQKKLVARGLMNGFQLRQSVDHTVPALLLGCGVILSGLALVAATISL